MFDNNYSLLFQSISYFDKCSILFVLFIENCMSNFLKIDCKHMSENCEIQKVYECTYIKVNMNEIIFGIRNKN